MELHILDAVKTTMKAGHSVTWQVCTLSVGGGVQVPTGQPRWEFFMADIPSPPGTTTHNPMDQLRCCEELAKSGK
jgi:hypothetical protein